MFNSVLYLNIWLKQKLKIMWGYEILVETYFKIFRNCNVLPIYYDLLIVMFVSIINIYVEQNCQSLFILINIINIIR